MVSILTACTVCAAIEIKSSRCMSGHAALMMMPCDHIINANQSGFSRYFGRAFNSKYTGRNEQGGERERKREIEGKRERVRRSETDRETQDERSIDSVA